jgi:peroxiredoxin
MAEIEKTAMEMGEAMPSTDVLFNAERRAEIAPKALPVMRRMAVLTQQLGQAAPPLKANMDQATQEVNGMMAILGDAAAQATLDKQALQTNINQDERASAQAWLFAIAWSKAMKDPRAQEKILTDYTALAKANAPNEMLAQVASLFCDYSATPALGAQAEDMVIKVLTSPKARELGTTIGRRRTRQGMEGKPLVVTALTHDGKPFSTVPWKGKVVLVEFWATWCAPCMADLPKIKKAYADFHDKGLEIVGVSSDHDLENFKKFLADNKDMPWPQLVDPVAAAAQDLHPFIQKYGLEGVPSMFLIDKKGNCRWIKPNENPEDVIKKLLAE